MKRKIITILAFSLSVVVFAQDYVFEKISTKNGLSQNEVNCILQDAQGFMWFGSNDGLNRYDGYDFEITRFNINEDKGLNSNLILSLAEDKYHNIWVGTTDRGLNIISYEDEEIINVIVPSNGRNLLEKEGIYNIDILDDLAIIMAKEEMYFFQISGNTYKPLKVNDNYAVKTGAFANRSYLRISENEFLLGTTNGLKHCKLEMADELKLSIKTYKNRINIQHIVSFRNGYLLACAQTLYFVDEHFKFDKFAYENYHRILVEDDMHAWGISAQGLDYLKFRNKNSVKFTVQKTFSKENTGEKLGNNRLRSIYKDKTGIIWLGTAGGGVSKLIKRGNKFQLYHDQLESSNLKYNTINCFFEDSEQNLWIGTDKDGISYFPSGTSDYNELSKHLRDDHYSKNNMLSFFEISIENKSYVVASTDYTINAQVYNLKGEKQQETRLYKMMQLIKHPISSMASDDKCLWLGTLEGGLYRYDYHIDSLIFYRNNTRSKITSNLVRCVCNDSRNRLWVATDKGLNLLLPEEKEKKQPSFIRFTHSTTDKTSLSYDYVLPIIETSDSAIWIGTLGGGLNKYGEENRTFQRFTTEDGLPNNNIKGILEDEKGRLWVSSNRGICSFDPTDKRIINFSLADGLQDYEFAEMSFGKRKNGEMLFGGSNGFNTFFPDKIEIDSTMPDMVFTSLHFSNPTGRGNKAFNRAQLTHYAENETSIDLKYGENSFTAFFSALHYIAPSKIKYKYRLSGYEDGWNNTAYQSRFAKYTNLHPGQYQLQVLATNSDGIWMKQPLVLSLTIHKPWYRSGIAYFIYVILIISSFLFFNRYSLIRNKMKHELLMERFEKEKEKELTQIKLRFFTNISHELRTPLTIIKSYFENIVPHWKSLPEEKVNEGFSVITSNINALLRMVSQILDFRKLEQDKMKIIPAKGNIVFLLDSILASFDILARHKNIDLSFEHTDDIPEFWFDRDNMEKIINNILSNAIKYTPEGGKVSIRMINLDNEVKIEIQDNGIGIPKEMQASIFERFFQADTLSSSKMESTGIGLSLTKGLVELHKGRIELVSNEGFGSNFILYFKKGKQHFTSDGNISLNDIKTDNISEVTPAEAKPKVDRVFQKEYNERQVLIVEDNKDLRAFLKEKLGEHFRIAEAENGREGLQKCLEIIPDIVISDIMMPEMNGYELCDTLKNDVRISHIPVILLTAKTSVESEMQGYRLGADAYVSKPFNMEVLTAQIISTLKSREKVLKRIAENPFFKPSEVTFTARDEEFLKKITGIIEARMRDPEFSVEELADTHGISKINLNKKIKALTGKTSVQFIRLLRLKKAADLLKVSGSRVSDVTYDVGYTDLQHFREHFKKEFSVSPSEYKKNSSA